MKVPDSSHDPECAGTRRDMDIGRASKQIPPIVKLSQVQQWGGFYSYLKSPLYSLTISIISRYFSVGT